MNRILLTGTLSTGKTTMLNHLKNLRGVYIVEEVARQLVEKNPTLEKEPFLQDILFREQVRKEEETIAEARSKRINNIFFDRGVLDIIAYSKFFGHTLKPEWFASMQGRYDHILLFGMDNVTNIPIIPELEVAIGMSMQDYRNLVDKSIRDVLFSLGQHFIEVEGDYATRINKVESFLGEISLEPVIRSERE